MNDLFEEVDVIPPFDKSIPARLEYMDHHEFHNVRVACIDTSTARLFVELFLGSGCVREQGQESKVVVMNCLYPNTPSL